MFEKKTTIFGLVWGVKEFFRVFHIQKKCSGRFEICRILICP